MQALKITPKDAHRQSLLQHGTLNEGKQVKNLKHC
jgi:hypothetical protein